MFKSIQQKLKDASILEENEPILSFIQVVDFNKQQQQFKKIAKEELASLVQNKFYYFLASIKTADNDSTPIIYLLKLNDKTNDFKLKVTYYLDDIKTITKIDNTIKQTLSNGNSLETNVYAFELLFRCDSDDSLNETTDQKLKFVWQCNKVEERNDFLDTLWKLSEQFLKASSRPKFINYKFEPKKTLVQTKDDEESNDNSIIKDINQQYEISKTDEDSLLKLMSECDFASSNAEKFIEKLQTELLQLDTSNIESIMNSEENTLKLIDMLDVAVQEIDKIDDRLKEYEDKISAVGDAVRIVGERDNVIQLQQNNQFALLELLESMIINLDFPAENLHVLKSLDLTKPESIRKVIKVANNLLDLLETELPSSLTKMKAYEEQKKTLEKYKISFCGHLCKNLRNAIGHATNKHLESEGKNDANRVTIPSHKKIHDDLLALKELVFWVHRSNCMFSEQNQTKTFYEDLKQNYIETIKQLYIKEVNEFCMSAKAGIAKLDRPRPNVSMENIKGSMIRSLEKSHIGDSFGSKTDQNHKDTLKAIFVKLLNYLTNAVTSEEKFCLEFFAIPPKQGKLDESIVSSNSGNSKLLSNLPRTNSNLSLVSTNTTSSKLLGDPKTDFSVLKEIFSVLIEDQVKQVMDSIIKTDYIMVLFLYSNMLAGVSTCHQNRQYMHQPMVGLLRFAKEKCDEFVRNFKEFISETKVNRKEKIGILKFVKYFEEFVKEAEICWEPIKNDYSEKLCNIYEGIVRDIFKAIEDIASVSQKTPQEVVLFQNYHQMTHIMRGINGLKDLTRKAREDYINWQKEYVKRLFGRPLEKIHIFFEKVQAKLDRGYVHQDISYQLELSANNLAQIISEYPAREVKRGLYDLYNKVEKHLEDNSSLLQVVWRDMSTEFITQYKNYETLIKLCYEGHNIKFDFTQEDIYKFFNEISIERSKEHKF
ncbi:unnamed protein product [Brachionus calyciflorus]|uniref:Exocyst complex component 1 n=1 Tax=Brachionus calyciflorus TaxID=104777 RepID=A0A813T740_9BILA|nr:unnamed protein product [Brachionus calyciflorus]